jgi:hypothetical protein
MRSKLSKLVVLALLLGLALELLRRMAERELTADSPGPALGPDPPAQPGPSEPARLHAQELAGASRAELYEEAKRRGIPGRSRMSKAQLQAALSEGA